MAVALTPDMLSAARRHAAVLSDAFMVRPWVGSPEIVETGLANSQSTARDLVDDLSTAGLLVQEAEGYTIPQELLEPLAEALPARSLAERLRRRVRLDFNPSYQRLLRSEINEILVSSRDAVIPLTRPSWHFDVKAILYPAISVDANLLLTDCSPMMEELAASALPNIKDIRGVTLESFLRGLDIRHYSYLTLEPTERHVLDGSGALEGVLDQLARDGFVKQKPIQVRVDGDQKYFEMSFVTQRAFPGIQSIWYQVDQRVGYMRMLKARRVVKYFIAGHRLKQPVNFFNMARAKLEVLRRRLGDSPFVNRVDEAHELLTLGIKDFRRFVQEVNKDDLRQTEGMATEEQVDLLAIAQETALDVDLLYGQNAGVKTLINIRDHAFGRYYLRADPYVLREAFFNIIHNSLKHGASKQPDTAHRTVSVGYEASRTELRLIVEDTGPGMKQDAIEALTRELEEVKPTSKSSELIGAVSGLVLASVVVRSLGGQMHFQNRDEGGLRTVLTFPLQGNTPNVDSISRGF